MPVIVRFIEFMDVGNRNAWDPKRVVPSGDLVRQVNDRWPIEPVSESYRGEVAQRWRFSDGSGEIGFISSVTQPFCAACSRARLSSDGRFYTCLFATEGLDLRAALRDGADDSALIDLIRGKWLRRTDRYSEQRDELRRGAPQAQKVEMYYIGG
jgi:cyclic pyranopterin phosphate synthase